MCKRKQFSIFVILVAVVITGCLARPLSKPDAKTSAQEDSHLFGDWTGESVCTVKESSCRDEKVIYHISKGSDPTIVNINADKIVFGKAVNMGTLEFKYDKVTGSLVNSEHGRWELILRERKIEGALTLANGTRYRRITLHR